MISVKFILEEKRAIIYDENIEIGECCFEEIDDVWNIVHTYVKSEYQGQGLARRLVECVKEHSLKYNKKLVAECSYANKILFH